MQVNMPMPDECRNQFTGNQHDMGCGETFVRSIEPLTGWISGLALLIFVLQILAISAIFLLRREIRSVEKKEREYQPVRTSKI